MNRAQLMLSVLQSADRPFSRDEIFSRVGHMLTNNAASELRARGYDVVRSQQRDPSGDGWIYFYRLAGVLPSEAGVDAAMPGSVGRSPATTASDARSTDELSPSRDADAVTSEPGPRRPSEFDRVIGEAWIATVLRPHGFVDETEIESHWLVDDGRDLVDDELADEAGEQQRALFLSEAA